MENLTPQSHPRWTLEIRSCESICRRDQPCKITSLHRIRGLWPMKMRMWVRAELLCFPRNPGRIPICSSKPENKARFTWSIATIWESTTQRAIRWSRKLSLACKVSSERRFILTARSISGVTAIPSRLSRSRMERSRPPLRIKDPTPSPSQAQCRLFLRTGLPTGFCGR